MFVASIEASNGDRLVVLSKDNQILGEMLVNFLLVLSNYCKGNHEYQWIQPLETDFEGDLCEAIQPLINTFYSGYWDYDLDEYELFRKRLGTDVPEITEDEFKYTIRRIRSMWADINVVHTITRQLIRSLQKSRITPVTALYEPPHTENEFEALARTLELLMERDVKQVRLSFV